MALSNHERIGKMLDLLRQGLGPFTKRELKAHLGDGWLEQAGASMKDPKAVTSLEADPATWDVSLTLGVLWNAWNSVFRKTLGPAERSLVSELREVRNEWAHQRPFSSDNAYRALDSAERLLTAVSADQARDIERMKLELLRLRFDEQARAEKRKTAGTAVESKVTGSLPPWRDVVSPHKDVASGRYQQAEFAADLWQVSIGEGSGEYRDPVEFFRRTYLTESLRRLLITAARRLKGAGGDPVVQLQTNFGGGKTHSMLALYHLFSGSKPSELVGIDDVMKEAEVPELPTVKPVVVVGNRISPGNPTTKSDGCVVHTLWGEIAWQLGGKKTYERVRSDDERGTCPGDVLREILNENAPTLILIDEWVAYARQLHDSSDLPGGSFETHFTFAQALTESVKIADRCLLVVSLPASHSYGSPHTQVDDVEVGGERGRAALDRLRNAVGRVETSWRPASAEEGFEIVRRRLFQPLMESSQFISRDTVAKAFSELYRSQHDEFPPECREPEYERRLKAAYPIHPEVFDRLYTDWSSLLKFQRTRGVLRLMATVIHSLWEKNDRNPLILPSNVPIDDPRVSFELTRYLSDNWAPVIEKDVDGPNALPLQIDSQVTNLGKHAACRRVARTIYMGSAPTMKAANRGLEERRITLGCLMPGESAPIFSDALRRLSAKATYLYQDGARYWYSTQPTVTKLAEDRAEQLRRDPDATAREIERRLRIELKRSGDFSRVHTLPQSTQDVPDDRDARLVVLCSEHPYSKEDDSPAERFARKILESRGNAPRLYRNTLVFLAVDHTRLQDLEDAIRRYLAWVSILEDQEELDLSPHQMKQAETQRGIADGVVNSRMPEGYQWLLAPTQDRPDGPVTLHPYRLSGSSALAERASQKLRGDQVLLTKLAGTTLRLELERIPLWRGEHVSLDQIAEDFARYVYLPRFKDPGVLVEAVRDGVAQISWPQDAFAYADSYDEDAGRYRGLRGGRNVPLSTSDLSGLLVHPDAALRQMKEEQAEKEKQGGESSTETDGGGATTVHPAVPPPGTGQEQTSSTDSPTTVLRRFHGSVELNPKRVSTHAGEIANEVITHLSGLVGAKVTITLDIEAYIEDGAPEHVVRTVTENAKTLKFKVQGFEGD